MFGAFPKNPEKEQAILRVACGSLAFLAYLIFTLVSPAKDAYIVLAAIALYATFGIVTYVAVTAGPARSHLRLILHTIFDQATVTMGLAVGGRAALPFLWLVFWFLIGAGCRYGRRMPALSCAVALAGFIGLMHWQPWWRTNITAGLGLTLSVAAIWRCQVGGYRSSVRYMRSYPYQITVLIASETVQPCHVPRRSFSMAR